MSSLFGTISISLRALLAQQAALQTTSDNISNINTPGYTRRRTIMVEEDPIAQGEMVVGNGVRVDGVESLRDRVLELRIDEETQQNGELQGFLTSMREVETRFSSVDSGIGADLDSVFAAITRLSTDPANISLRQNVLTAAGNLASSIASNARNLRSQQQDIDKGLSERVDQVNQLSSQIASLNQELSSSGSSGIGSGDFAEDQRTEALHQLSALIGVSVVDSSDGVAITIANGAPLVVGNNSFALRVEPDGTGEERIFAGVTDITDSIAGGEIAGMIRARDAGIGDLLGKLNTLAAGVATAFNIAHQQGFDLNGSPGGELFAHPTSTDAAANMRLELTDPAKLAASSDGSSGDNGNLSQLGAICSSATVAGKSPGSFYAGLVAGVGSQVATAQAEQSSCEVILQQLQNQRASISGVSLDEEAANLIRYQRAFEAAARVISVVNDLTETVIGLGRN